MSAVPSANVPATAVDRAAPEAAPPGPWREFWGQLSANTGAMVGLAVVIAVLLMAAFAPWLAPHPPNLTNPAAFLKPPAWQAGGDWTWPLGTDAIGRDILSRLIHGARLSLLIGLAVVTLAIVTGTVLGLLAGFSRGWVDVVIMRTMDVILTLPNLLLAIVIVAILGPGLMNAMLAVSVVVLPHWLVEADKEGRWSVTMQMSLDTSRAEALKFGRRHVEAEIYLPDTQIAAK